MLGKRIRMAVVTGVCVALTTGVEAGTGAKLPQSGTLDLLDGADVVIDGLPAGSETGYSVGAAGDVNGDGRPDMLVGARGAAAAGSGRAEAGAVYVVFGRTERAPVDLANLGSGGFRIDGAVAGDGAGSAVASAGDLNGDGLADVLVGAPQADRSADARDAGAAYVVFGKASPDPVDLAALGPAGYRVGGVAAGDSAGFAVSSAGDLNGDGTRELIVGAPRASVGDRTHAGSAYVVFGKGTPGDIDLASGFAGYRLDGAQNGQAGWSVAGSPDMNGDGKPEVLLGAPYTSPNDSPFGGSAYAVWGKSSSDTIDLSNLGEGGYELFGGESGGPGDQPSTEAAGAAVAPVGDTNGDGTPDFAVAGQLADRDARRNSGAVYVVYGRAQAGSLPLDSVQGSNGWRIDGANAADQTGATIANAGDFNGDGRGDMIVAAPLANPFSRQNAGASYVVFGQPQNADIDLSALGPKGIRIAGAEPGDVTSRSVAGVGDVNGDGGPDVLLGSVYNRNGEPPPRDPATGEPGPPPEGAAEREQTGAAYVVYGPRPDPGEPPPDAGETEEVAAGCVAAKNVEAIVDDSGSMEETDPDVLRRLALEILLTKPRNQGETLGAVEFGSEADQLFPPLEVESGQEQDELLALIERELRADNGGTDYNAAFSVLADENPGAAARIFLTDGAHNAGRYELGHLNGPPTFVIGLGIGRRGGDGQRLQRIADETKGRYFPSVDRDELQAVLNGIDSRLNCDIELETLDGIITDDPGDDAEEDEPRDDVEDFEEELDEDAHSADVVVSWDDEEDDLEVDEIAVEEDDGDVVQRIRAKSLRRLIRSGKRGGRRGLRVQGFAGDTYQSFRATGLRQGTLKVRVRARRVQGQARVTTQISQSRRRR